MMMDEDESNCIACIDIVRRELLHCIDIVRQELLHA